MQEFWTQVLCPRVTSAFPMCEKLSQNSIQQVQTCNLKYTYRTHIPVAPEIEPNSEPDGIQEI